MKVRCSLCRATGTMRRVRIPGYWNRRGEWVKGRSKYKLPAGWFRSGGVKCSRCF